MPGHVHHQSITREAVRALPAWARERLPGDMERLLLDECCMNPDRYFDLFGGGHDRIKPYTLLIDGIQFHYLPNSPIEGEYKFWGVVEDAEGRRRLRRVRVEENENWRHAREGFTFYIENASAALREGRLVDAANYLGILLHVLEDASTLLHSLEGPDGVDIFALNRLVPAPEGRLDLLATSLLSGGEAECDTGAYTPELLGVSDAEAAFRLYTCYARTVAANRAKLVPLLLRIRAGDETGAEALRAEVLRRSARLCADAAYTVFCMAFERFDPSEAEALRTVRLSDLKRVREPRGLSVPYRFITWLPDAALDERQERRPLRLRLDGRDVDFEKGIGSGSHFDYTMAWELPPGVYRRFSGAVGFHPELSRDPDFEAEVRLQGQAVFRTHVDPELPAEAFDLDVDGGGMLELGIECPWGMGGKAGAVNSIVWADLKLEK